ncbi:MAG: hypothetical protein SVU32_08740, partial [Candidatus Nanohaloarchaea archaeon]|nr:hypothetical protein [Candidatus Nanohaloarchaea archaeon]
MTRLQQYIGPFLLLLAITTFIGGQHHLDRQATALELDNATINNNGSRTFTVKEAERLSRLTVTVDLERGYNTKIALNQGFTHEIYGSTAVRFTIKEPSTYLHDGQNTITFKHPIRNSIHIEQLTIRSYSPFLERLQLSLLLVVFLLAAGGLHITGIHISQWQNIEDEYRIWSHRLLRTGTAVALTGLLVGLISGTTFLAIERPIARPVIEQQVNQSKAPQRLRRSYRSSLSVVCERSFSLKHCSLERMTKAFKSRSITSYKDIQNQTRDAQLLAMLYSIEAVTDGDPRTAPELAAMLLTNAIVLAQNSILSEHQSSYTSRYIEACKTQNISPSKCYSRIQEAYRSLDTHSDIPPPVCQGIPIGDPVRDLQQINNTGAPLIDSYLDILQQMGSEKWSHFVYQNCIMLQKY